MAFGSYAQYYDLIYSEKDYIGETNFLYNIGGFSAGISILDLGCGTGGHALLLAQRGYQVTGVDLSEGMLNLAKQKAVEKGLPATFLPGDIRSIRLRKKFDLVISMFAVMSYQTRNEDFTAALRTAREHLVSDGLFIFDAWYGPAVLKQRPETRMKEIIDKEERIIRIAAPEMDLLASTVTVHYTILRLAGDQVRDETHEAHPMRYFFAPEVEYYASHTGFEIVKLCPFMEADRQPDEQDWNVTWILRAV